MACRGETGAACLFCSVREHPFVPHVAIINRLDSDMVSIHSSVLSGKQKNEAKQNSASEWGKRFTADASATSAGTSQSGSNFTVASGGEAVGE